MRIQLEQGRRYVATISLGFFERIASNDQIAAKLCAAGFSQVSVTGSGATRAASGTWTWATEEVELPSQVSNLRPA